MKILKSFLIAVPVLVISVLSVLYISYLHYGGTDYSLEIKSIRELIIYDIIDPIEKNLSFYNYNATKSTIDGTKLKILLDDIKFHKGNIIWKGCFLGIGKLEDGSEIKLRISFGGGVLKIIGRRGYYLTEGKSRKMFEETMERILVNDFMPARRARNNAQ